MAEEKMMDGKYYKGPCRRYFFVGVLAIVYGVINYMINVMDWQPYMAWIIGGVILLLVSWAKGSAKS